MSRVLVAGVGNIFLGDDGFGVEVAARLAGQRMPAGVRVADYGIRGVHLAYELLEGYDGLILVDAVSRGEPPGTVFVIEPDLDGIAVGPGGPTMDAHSMSPDIVFALLKSLDASLDEVYVVGCEPADISERMGLSAEVAASVEGAVTVVRQLAAKMADRGKKQDVV